MPDVKNLAEHQILTILKILPFVIPIIVGTIITTLYLSNQKKYNEDILALKNTYIVTEKKLIKNEVLKIRKHILIKQNSIKNRVKKKVRDRVYEAHTIATSIYEKYKGKKSSKEIQRLIVHVLKDMRFFNGRGYYFINQNNGKAVLFNGVSKLGVELNLSQWSDVKGNRIVQDQIDVIRSKGEGFNTKFHKMLDIKPIKDKVVKEYEKITFVKNFKPYDWHIGSGDYLYNEQNNVKEELLEELVSDGDFNKKVNNTEKYMMVTDLKGNILYHPNSKLLSINLGDLKDVNNKPFGKEMLGIRSSAYIEYYFKNPATEKISKKIAYGNYIPQMQWIVGSGFYLDKMEQAISKEKQKLYELNQSYILYIGVWGLIGFIISILASIYITNMIKKIFIRYQKKINLHVDELQTLNETLEIRIKQAIDDIHKKDRQLTHQTRLAQMGEMISMIAHQWRQPLSTIASIVMDNKLMLKLENFDISKEEDIKKYKLYLNESFNNIEKYTAVLSDIIDDFRNFYKPNKQSISVKLNESILKSLNIVHSSLISENINVITEYHSEDKFDIYENEVMHVILNIIKNSQDNFREKKTENPYIKIKTFKNNISICDNGGGISEEIIDKVFDPYFSTKDEKNGTGLGLYMSKNIIEDHHNGKLTVKNTAEGVCFIIEFEDTKTKSVS